MRAGHNLESLDRIRVTRHLIRFLMRVPRVQLQPDLSHCIETVARDEYERGLRRLLAGKGGEELAERTELLRLFLEEADFRDLRAQSERHLLAGKKVACIVYVDEETVRYKLQIS